MDGWLSIPGTDPSLVQSELEASLNSRIASGSFSLLDVKNIKNRELSLIPKDLKISALKLEKLRRLCQLWEVDIRSVHIASHRKVIGPFIVRAKRILFPLVRFAMKDFIREQRDFNAATISLFADLCNESEKKREE